MTKEFRTAATLVKGACETLALKIVRKPAKLYGLVFEATDACNSHCQHCNIWRQKPTSNPLTLKEIEKIFQNPFFKNLKEVIITGGEALLRPDLEEIILAMHKYIQPNVLISLSTNGLLPERAIKATKKLLENGVNLIVGVSLDAVGKKHDEIRGTKGNFEKVDFLLHELVSLQSQYKNKLRVIVGFTLSSLTVNLMKEVELYAENLGFQFLPQVYEEGPFYFNEGNVRKGYNKNLIKAVKNLPSSFQKEIMLKAASGENIKFRCYSMNTFFVLHCNGDISPCLRHSDIRLGNLRERSIDKIWQSQEVKEARKMIKNCSDCYNTWAIGWSMQAWFPSFFNLLLRTVLKKKRDKLK